MKNPLSGSIIINAILFQITWFACAIGGANNLLWPAILSCGVLAAFQLHTKNRHPNDVKLVFTSLLLGLTVDSLWIHLDLISYSMHWPISTIAPLWIIILWLGFALTINHSLSWLKQHPLLPAICGFIFAPLSYIAGVKLGALTFVASQSVIIIGLGLAWAAAMTILVNISKSNS